MTVFEAYTPPPGPMDATLNMKRARASTKSAEPLEYMAPENVGRVDVNDNVNVNVNVNVNTDAGGRDGYSSRCAGEIGNLAR